MVLKITKPAGKATTEVTEKVKGKTLSEVKQTEEVPAPASNAEVVESAPCVVTVEASYTHNLGDYKSCRVGVQLSIPCRHAEINDTFTYSENWVNERLSGMMKDIGATE